MREIGKVPSTQFQESIESIETQQKQVENQNIDKTHQANTRNS